MRRRSNPAVNSALAALARAKRETRRAIWKSVAERISASVSRRAEVNVGKIRLLTQEGQAVIVPGKVLGIGGLDHRTVVGALSFSSSARSKILSAGGEALDIESFIQRFPEGRGVKIVAG